ncbi:ribosome assembly protein METTL17, mitochondrial [Megalopta genalis]|uniref:ribosome assembly protein METTL17, mitochondrial n=1 Tax=Megalopta genalis TaxID=115081 RepID=UPI003FD2A2F6
MLFASKRINGEHCLFMMTKLTFARYRQLRLYSTISESNSLYKSHPGIVKPRVVNQPKQLYEVIRSFIRDEHMKKTDIYENAKNLALHLHGRHIPPEVDDLVAKWETVKSRIGGDIEEEDLKRNRYAKKLYKTLVYNWAPIQYDTKTGLAYLISRSVPEYSALYKIFNEIRTKDTDFTPTSLFDFGSGIGTTIWAASDFWLKSIKEYYCVDVSANMNDLSAHVVKRIRPEINFKYIFHRQFLPASASPTYDIVVSAYSLFELPNQKSRIELIAKLWKKTSQYLVIVEQGTKAGFDLINEAREFILMYNKSEVHVFSPCPHDLECPRSADETPCNFELSYLTLPFPEKSEYKHERYSYVVFKKGDRAEDDDGWPRIVRPVLKRSKHTICRMCTAAGELKEYIFTEYKNGKTMYKFARCSKWGDRLPFAEIEEMTTKQETGETVDVKETDVEETDTNETDVEETTEDSK